MTKMNFEEKINTLASHCEKMQISIEPGSRSEKLLYYVSLFLLGEKQLDGSISGYSLEEALDKSFDVLGLCHHCGSNKPHKELELPLHK